MKQSLLCARLTVLVAFSVFVGWCAGCGSGGPPTGSVSGKVTYNSQPLTAGVVTFINEEAGRGASSDLDASGQYRIPALQTGQYKVAIHRQPPPVNETSPQTIGNGRLSIPEKYQDFQSSGLTATVKEGKNTTDFNL